LRDFVRSNRRQLAAISRAPWFAVALGVK